MTKAQKELIREAYAKEVDGEGWRKRMERWLNHTYCDPFNRPEFNRMCERADKEYKRSLDMILIGAL